MHISVMLFRTSFSQFSDGRSVGIFVGLELLACFLRHLILRFLIILLHSSR